GGRGAGDGGEVERTAWRRTNARAVGIKNAPAPGIPPPQSGGGGPCGGWGGGHAAGGGRGAGRGEQSIARGDFGGRGRPQGSSSGKSSAAENWTVSASDASIRLDHTFSISTVPRFVSRSKSMAGDTIARSGSVTTSGERRGWLNRASESCG